MRRAALVLLVLLMPVSAFAQEVSRSFAALSRQGVVNEGDTVWITFSLHEGGQFSEWQAKVVELTPEAITIHVDSLPALTTDLTIGSDRRGRLIEIPEGRVQRMEWQRHDSLVNGALIGLGVGAGAGILWFAALAGEEFESVIQTDLGAGYAAGLTLLGAGIGATVGAAIDGARKPPRQSIYLAPELTMPAFTYSLAPIVTKSRKGVLFTLTW